MWPSRWPSYPQLLEGKKPCLCSESKVLGTREHEVILPTGSGALGGSVAYKSSSQAQLGCFQKCPCPTLGDCAVLDLGCGPLEFLKPRMTLTCRQVWDPLALQRPRTLLGRSLLTSHFWWVLDPNQRERQGPSLATCYPHFREGCARKPQGVFWWRV